MPERNACDEFEEMFLANYADGVTDLDLGTYIDEFAGSGQVAAGEYARRFLPCRQSDRSH